MSKKSKIKFYKGTLRVLIQRQMSSIGTYKSLDEIDVILKNYSDLNKSCLLMEDEELKELIFWSKEFALEIGLKIDNESDIDFDSERTN